MTDWRLVHGSSKPAPVDSTSSISTVYVTRNAHEVEREDIGGRKIVEWEWEEMTYTKEEWAIHLAEEAKTIQESLMEYMGLKGKWNGNVFEVVKEEKESGDYTNPILIPVGGIETVKGKWYYVDDKELPHEAKADAFVTREDFYDNIQFDFVQ